MFLGLCAVAYLYSVSLRVAGIIQGRMMLKGGSQRFSAVWIRHECFQ